MDPCSMSKSEPHFSWMFIIMFNSHLCFASFSKKGTFDIVSVIPSFWRDLWWYIKMRKMRTHVSSQKVQKFVNTHFCKKHIFVYNS